MKNVQAVDDMKCTTEKKKHGTISMILMLTRGKLNTSLGIREKGCEK